MSEIEELRAEVAKLREEVAAQKARGVEVHHHYHGQPPSLLPPPSERLPGQPYPYTATPPYWPSTARGSAVAGGTDVRCENGPRSL
jgi:hypothetical protein